MAVQAKMSWLGSNAGTKTHTELVESQVGCKGRLQTSMSSNIQYDLVCTSQGKLHTYTLSF